MTETYAADVVKTITVPVVTVHGSEEVTGGAVIRLWDEHEITGDGIRTWHSVTVDPSDGGDVSVLPCQVEELVAALRACARLADDGGRHDREA